MKPDWVEFWDKQPCNIRHPSPLFKLAVEPHILPFLRPWEWAGMSVLDVGCGIGTLSNLFHQCGAIVTGIDVSLESIQVARQRYPDIRFIHGDFCEGYFGEYDLVFAFGSMHHSRHQQEFADRLNAAAFGSLKVMCYHKYALKRMMRERVEAQAGCPIVNYYTPGSLRTTLGLQGKAWVDHIHWWRTPYGKTLTRRPLWNLVRCLEPYLGWHVLYERNNCM